MDFDSLARNLKNLALRSPAHLGAVELLLRLYDGSPDHAARLTYWLDRFRPAGCDAEPTDVLGRIARPEWSNDFSIARMAIVQAGPAKYPPEPVSWPKSADAVVLKFLHGLITAGESLPTSVSDRLSAKNTQDINHALPTWIDTPLRSVKQLERALGVPLTRGLLSAIHTALAQSQATPRQPAPEVQENGSLPAKEITTGHLRELAIMINRIEESDLDAVEQKVGIGSEMVAWIRPLLDRYYSNAWEFEAAAEKAWALTPQATAVRLTVVLAALEVAWPQLENMKRLHRSDAVLMPLQNLRAHLNTWIGESAWIADLGERGTITGPFLTNNQAPAPRVMRQHGKGLNGGQYIRLSVIGRDNRVHVCEILPGWKPFLRPGRSSEPPGITANIPVAQALYFRSTVFELGRPGSAASRRLVLTAPTNMDMTETSAGTEVNDKESQTQRLPELEKRVLQWAQTKEASPPLIFGPVRSSDIQRNSDNEWKLDYISNGRLLASLTYHFDSSSLGLFVSCPKNGSAKLRQEYLHALLLEILSYYPQAHYLSIHAPASLAGWLNAWTPSKVNLFSHISFSSFVGNVRTIRGSLAENSLSTAESAIQPLIVRNHAPLPVERQLAAPGTDSHTTPQVFAIPSSREIKIGLSPAVMTKSPKTELTDRPFLDRTEWRSKEVVDEASLGLVIISGLVKRRESDPDLSIASIRVEDRALVVRPLWDFKARPVDLSRLSESQRRDVASLLDGKPLPAQERKKARRQEEEQREEEHEKPPEEPEPALVIEPETPALASLMSIAPAAFQNALQVEGIKKPIVRLLEQLRQENPRHSILDFLVDVVYEEVQISRKDTERIEAALEKLGVMLHASGYGDETHQDTSDLPPIDPAALSDDQPHALLGWDAETVARLISAALRYTGSDVRAIDDTGLITMSEWKVIRNYVFPEAPGGYLAMQKALQQNELTWDTFEWALQALEEVEEGKRPGFTTSETLGRGHDPHATDLERAS